LCNSIGGILHLPIVSKLLVNHLVGGFTESYESIIAGLFDCSTHLRLERLSQEASLLNSVEVFTLAETLLADSTVVSCSSTLAEATFLKTLPPYMD
jgi:hypothetical protein